MCLSLIQENVGLYSSYFIKKDEEEETELDIIIPQKRIPNWGRKMDALLKNGVTNIEDAMDVQHMNVPGMEEVDSDSDIESSGSDPENEDDSSSDSNNDDVSEDENEGDDSENENEDNGSEEETEDSEDASSSSSDDSDSEDISVISEAVKEKIDSK